MPRLAVMRGDVVSSKAIADRAAFGKAMTQTRQRLNETFAGDLARPFAVAAGDELRGALADACLAPRCVSLLRETLAPILIRVGVGIADDEKEGAALAAAALADTRRERGLTRYAGLGEGGDVIVNGLCRLTDPLLRGRTVKQWEAVRLYRAFGDQRRVAARLRISRQSVGGRLEAGQWRALSEADAAVAAYLALRTESRG